MTREEAIAYGKRVIDLGLNDETQAFCKIAIKSLEQEPVDKSAMMLDIYMEGVNMSGEYQGCWVRFKDIEKIVDKYIGSEE